MTPDPPIARLTGVSAGYATAGGHRPVLDGLDLEIRPGELLAIVGANGSGKTTLLRVLAGTLRPDRGDVELLGRPMATWSRRDIGRRVGVLPQVAELPAGFRVAEAVALGRIPHATRMFGEGADDGPAVQGALRDADAADLADRRVTELSGGERQRVALALALAQEPRLLLLDEPTLHLDIGHQLGLLRLLERLCRSRGIAVVAVLHDLNLAMAADRTLLLDGGRAVSVATPGGGLDLARLRDAFGVAITEAVTVEGRRILAPVRAGTAVVPGTE